MRRVIAASSKALIASSELNMISDKQLKAWLITPPEKQLSRLLEAASQFEHLKRASLAFTFAINLMVVINGLL